MPALPVEPVTPRRLAALREDLPAHLRPILDAMAATGCGFLIVGQHVGAFDLPTVPLFVALVLLGIFAPNAGNVIETGPEFERAWEAFVRRAAPDTEVRVFADDRGGA